MYNKKIEKDVMKNIRLVYESDKIEETCIVIELYGFDDFNIKRIYDKTVKYIEKHFDKNGYLIPTKFFDYYRDLTDRMNKKAQELNTLVANTTFNDFLLKDVEKDIERLHKERLELLVEFDIYDYLVTMHNREILIRNNYNKSNLKFYKGKK